MLRDVDALRAQDECPCGSRRPYGRCHGQVRSQGSRSNLVSLRRLARDVLASVGLVLPAPLRVPAPRAPAPVRAAAQLLRTSRRCRACGCSALLPCSERCHWVTPTLCSRCNRGFFFDQDQQILCAPGVPRTRALPQLHAFAPLVARRGALFRGRRRR